MATLTNLPNLSKNFEKLKIMLDLETYLTHNKPTITGQAILNAINGKKFTHEQILQYVKDQAADSRKTMENCISEQLLNRILNYQP
jgi:hypothetical protein